MASTIQDLKRASHIVNVLIQKGFAKIIYDTELSHHLPFHKKISFGKKELPADLPVKLREVLEDLGGAYVKLGQVLSLRPDLIPEEYCEEFKKLLDQVPAFSFEEVKQIVEKEIKKPIDKVLSSFEKVPIGSASISQVHKAKLKNGKDVVVKILRPNIRQKFDEDMDIMYYIARKLDSSIKRHISFISIVDEFKKYTQRELNLIFEGKNIDRFYSCFEGSKTVVIPKVFWQYTTENILLMEYIDGVKLSEVNKSSLNKKILAKTIFDACFKQIFDFGVFHADLHPGNIIVINSNKIALIDFGIIGNLSHQMRIDGIKIYVSLINKDTDGIIRTILDVGVPSPDTDIELLKDDINNLVNDWYYSSTKNIKTTSLLFRILNTCINHKISMPIDLILYGKALITVEGTCLTLDPEFNFVEMAKPKVVEFLKKQRTPRAIINKFISKSKSVVELLYDLPEETYEIIKKIKSGRISLDLEDSDIKHLGFDINTSSNRLSYAIIIGALVLASALFIDIKPFVNGYSLISLFFLFLATIFSISFLMSVYKEGREKYDSHRKI